MISGFEWPSLTHCRCRRRSSAGVCGALWPRNQGVERIAFRSVALGSMGRTLSCGLATALGSDRQPYALSSTWTLCRVQSTEWRMCVHVIGSFSGETNHLHPLLSVEVRKCQGNRRNLVESLQKHSG